MKEELKQQMAQAMKEIAQELNSKHSNSSAQETNIFKILKVDQYEIRHGAFLEFLLDPERNPELADFFLQEWLKEIVSELVLQDEQLKKIIEGDYEKIGHINEANRYSEIPFNNKGNINRIDHALEVSLRGTRRVLVFEYKHNGILQNDLVAYRNYVEKQYEGKRVEIYCFVLELDHKSHDKSGGDGWSFISRETLINAISETLREASRKDMQATRLYLEHYLQVLQPDPEDYELLKGFRAELWDLWNPEVAQVDPDAEYFEELLEKYVGSVHYNSLISSFHYHLLFDWAVAEAAESIGNIRVRVNSGWVRLNLNNNYKNLYLSTFLHEEENGQLYMAIELRSWHDTKISEQESKVQYDFLRDALFLHPSIKDSLNELSDPDDLRYITLVKDGGTLLKRNHPKNCKTPFDLSLTWLWPIDQQTLKIICTQGKPQVFNEWIKELEWWVEALS